MKNEIKVVFFDLFFTLVVPKYNNKRNENDILGISKSEWEKISEDEDLYKARAIGIVKNPENIIADIIKKANKNITENEIREIQYLREERFRKSLIDVNPIILDVLKKIKNKGKKICLISNADIIDVMYWRDSPLSGLFDEVIFSYDVGFIKPCSEIYEIALKRMNVIPGNSIFVGDGGSNELLGAKNVGMNTILVEHFLKRNKKQSSVIKLHADYHVDNFLDLINILD